MQSNATSWIWADAASGGVKGARIDMAAGFIEWVDQPGCACGDAVARQTIADFLAKAPFESPPPDVLSEMRDAVNERCLLTGPTGVVNIREFKGL